MSSQMSWCEKQGRVSRAFDEWKLIDLDQRTFLRLGLEFASREYDRLWQESGLEPYEEDGPDHLESFENKVGGLRQQDFDWMHLSGITRDAVTNFEVYLEKAREEILAHHGKPTAPAAESPKWGQIRRFFAQFGIEVDTEDVKQVRRLRHFLSHRRGELRTEELRATFQATHSDLFPPWYVELDPSRVIDALEVLTTAVRAIDASVYEYSWGRARVPDLQL
jgi:hypothetical protein